MTRLKNLQHLLRDDFQLIWKDAFAKYPWPVQVNPDSAWGIFGDSEDVVSRRWIPLNLRHFNKVPRQLRVATCDSQIFPMKKAKSVV
jgi:hypothetical protein